MNNNPTEIILGLQLQAVRIIYKGLAMNSGQE